MNKKNMYLVALAVIAIIIANLFDQRISFDFAGVGDNVSLKEANEAKKTEAKVNAAVQLNQTTEQSLFQALAIGKFVHQNNGAYFGANFVGGVSSEFGVCTPVMSVNGGYDFGRFAIEAKLGKFKRTSLVTCGVDAQFSNFAILLGEGAGVNNAMQLSLVKHGLRLSLGHADGCNFYNLTDGNWYVCAEVPVGKYVNVAGGVDFSQSVTGYMAGKVNVGNNTVTVTANKLGADGRSVVASYNRNNIVLRNCVLSLSASYWWTALKQGIHTVAGFTKGKSTLFAEVGVNKIGVDMTPKVNLGLGYVLNL